MVLSGQAPGAIGQALAAVRGSIRGDGAERVDLWAVHPGGRSVLEAVEEGLGLAPEDLRDSREVLRCFGNMSSATVMFVLERMMRSATAGQRGCAMAFGPGLTAETMRFHVS
jgi:alpha-pyrone synthase